MLTLKQIRTIQFFMDNLSNYCEFNKISFPFSDLIVEYDGELITANWIDSGFEINHESVVNLRTKYLSGYSATLFANDRLSTLLNDRTKLTELILKIATEFTELNENNWVVDVTFLKSKVSIKNYLFQPDTEFNLVSF